MWLASQLQTDTVLHLLLQLPRERGGSVAGQGCSSTGSYSVSVAPAGGRNDRHGQLQPRRPQGAWLLVRRKDPEEEGDAYPARGLCQNSPWVRVLPVMV